MASSLVGVVLRQILPTRSGSCTVPCDQRARSGSEARQRNRAYAWVREAVLAVKLREVMVRSSEISGRSSGHLRALAKRMLFSKSLPDWLFLSITNLRFAILRSQTRFFLASKGLYLAREGDSYRYFDSRQRGYIQCQHGLSQRYRQIFSSYLLDEVPLNRSHTVIDCGANYGDLWGLLSERIDPANYFAFEPSSRDFRLLQKNVSPLAVCEQKALGNNSGSLLLYVASEKGDSSLIQPASFETTEMCAVFTLDDYCRVQGISKIRLLKIEAEGAEVEVLQGAATMLQFTDYVCFDGSPERGVSKESTFASVVNMLWESGFYCLDVNFRWHRALFVNASLSNE